jgi:hypothetical protein
MIRGRRIPAGGRCSSLRLCPISSLLAPCHPGAALRDSCHESLFLDTSSGRKTLADRARRHWPAGFPCDERCRPPPSEHAVLAMHEDSDLKTATRRAGASRGLSRRLQFQHPRRTNSETYSSWTPFQPIIPTSASAITTPSAFLLLALSGCALVRRHRTRSSVRTSGSGPSHGANEGFGGLARVAGCCKSGPRVN